MLLPAPLACLALLVTTACVTPLTEVDPVDSDRDTLPSLTSASEAPERTTYVFDGLADTEDLAATSLPAGWESSSLLAFEAELKTVSELGDFDDASYQALQRALQDDTAPTVAVRAALLLAAQDSLRADQLLLEQLESRQPHPDRPADAADVVAAAHLARSSRAEILDIPAILAQLADGDAPHPDLEVRTECARGALLLGRTEVAPFLLRLTRLDTPLGLARDGAWHSVALTTWSRSRAAEALAEVLGIPCPYRADASLADREAGALELEAAWAAANPLRE